MTTFTNARKMTLARTLGTLTGAGVAAAITKDLAVVCPLAAGALVGIAYTHKKMADADKALEGTDVECVIPTSTLVKAGVFSAVEIGLGGWLIHKGKKWFNNRNAAKDVDVVTEAPVTPVDTPVVA